MVVVALCTYHIATLVAVKQIRKTGIHLSDEYISISEIQTLG